VAPRIGLNLLYLAPGDTGGTEVYARALVPRLAEAWPEAEWTIFCGRELGAELRERPWAPGVRAVTLPVSSHTRVRRVAAEQALLPAAIARSRVDLVHSLASTTPILAPCRTVVTIHDVIYKRHPDAHAGLLTQGMALLVPAAARRANRIIVSAQAAGDDLQRYLGVPPGKIDVVPLGPGLEPDVAPTGEAELRERLGLGDGPLVLSVSARRPHKNLPRLIDAMRGVDATLVLPGYPTVFDEELRAHAADARVVFAGWVDDADLEGLYGAATLLAFPSLAEGFGLPVLEAMRRGLPVACSGTTSLPELVGDAALTFDPESTDAIRGSIVRLLGDAALRADLARRGRERAELFSWERTARGCVATYRRVLGA
jgi:glycosyltransferase involved in cell wall biosynthesis